MLASLTLVPLVAVPASARSSPGRSVAIAGDFNGDGEVDAAVSAPSETVDHQLGAGAVYVFFGSAAGVRTDNAIRITKATPGIPGQAGQAARFGLTLAVGDFDGDGHSDLAIGDPGRTVNGKTNAGGVVVVPGSQSGLDPSRAVAFDETAFGATAEQNDEYGRSLAAGDFNGDGIPDLAIGTELEGVGGHAFAGAVGVLYGHAGTGLRTTGAQLLTQGRIPGQTTHTGGNFGVNLASGDLDGDGTDDLLIEAFERKGGGCSVVDRVPGSSHGLVPASAQTLDPSLLPGPGCSDESGGRFGMAMAVGRFDGATPELAVGAGYQDVGGHQYAGAVYLVPGGHSGLTIGGSKRITESTAGVAGSPRTEGNFGGSLAAANFGNGGDDDLAVLAEGQHVGGTTGGVDVFYGGAAGLDLDGQYLSHATPGVPSPNQDLWLTTLSAADVGNGHQADLLGGASLDSVNGTFQAGAAYVLYGTTNGVTGAGSLRVTPASPGVPGDPGEGALFGTAVV